MNKSTCIQEAEKEVSKAQRQLEIAQASLTKAQDELDQAIAEASGAVVFAGGTCKIKTSIEESRVRLTFHIRHSSISAWFIDHIWTFNADEARALAALLGARIKELAGSESD